MPARGCGPEPPTAESKNEGTPPARPETMTPRLHSRWETTHLNLATKTFTSTNRFRCCNKIEFRYSLTSKLGNGLKHLCFEFERHGPFVRSQTDLTTRSRWTMPVTSLQSPREESAEANRWAKEEGSSPNCNPGAPEIPRDLRTSANWLRRGKVSSWNGALSPPASKRARSRERRTKKTGPSPSVPSAGTNNEPSWRPPAK